MMEAIYRRCAGVDVHSKTLAVCVRSVNESGQVEKQVRTFGTMTRDLLALNDWLLAEGVTHVAMESTGVFWKPVYNLLEAQFHILLVNARHVKNVPGRKTDVKDCEWLAQLLQCGLLRASFIPPRPQRELRDLTRMRMQLRHELGSVANRIHKVLEDANIKLGGGGGHGHPGRVGAAHDRGPDRGRDRCRQDGGSLLPAIAGEDPAVAVGARREGDRASPLLVAGVAGSPRLSGKPDRRLQPTHRAG